VYRCSNLTLGEEDCILVNQLNLGEDEFELLQIIPKTYLGTTVFFLYKKEFDKTYMFYINFEEGELNYEVMPTKLLDAKFMHLPNGQIIGEFLTTGKGLLVEVFYQDWSFGGRKRVTIDDSLLGSLGFCGK